MKKVLIFTLVIMSCGTIEPQDDCAGVPGGTSVEDCAGVCDGTSVEDCAGECGGTSVEDCVGVCGGTSVEDCVGVCGGETEVCLSIKNISYAESTFDIYMVNSESVAGFQFELFGITLSGASGGSAAEYLDLITTNSNTKSVLGVSISGGSIPPGEAVLTQISFSTYAEGDICFGTDPVNNLISDSASPPEALRIDWSECLNP